MCPTTELGNKRQGHMKPDTRREARDWLRHLLMQWNLIHPRAYYYLYMKLKDPNHVLVSDHDLRDKSN